FTAIGLAPPTSSCGLWRRCLTIERRDHVTGLPEPVTLRGSDCMYEDAGTPVASLDDVLITRELHGRPARRADFAGESEALQRLVQLLADDPHILLQRLLSLARQCCQADSAGVTLLERGADGREVLRWVAAAGPLSKQVGGVSLRERSAFGVCLERS